MIDDHPTTSELTADLFRKAVARGATDHETVVRYALELARRGLEDRPLPIASNRAQARSKRWRAWATKRTAEHERYRQAADRLERFAAELGF